MADTTSTHASTIAARDERVYWCHILAIEGIPYLWTDDTTAELLGSGVGTWMGTTESGLGWQIGQRTVLPGLVLPRSFRESIDPKVGSLQQASHSIRIVDYEGVVADLLATEGKDYDLLGEDIQPGLTSLGTSVAIVGGTTVNPRGRWLGLEAIGPNGERGYFPAFPFTVGGYHHRANILGSTEDGPKPVPISTSPLDFQGRTVTVWRLVRRDFPRPSNYTAWPTWDDQAEVEGCRVFLGKMLDRGSIKGNREWEIRCGGAESFTRRTLNAYAPSWMPITDAPVELSDDQTSVAILLYHAGSSGDWDLSVGFRDILSLVGDHDTWITQINALMANVVAGTDSDFGVDPWSDFGHATARFLEDGALLIQRDPIDGLVATPEGGVGMKIVMHENVWRQLGFDPPLQACDIPLSEETQCRFQKYDAGDTPFGASTGATNANVPGDNYWALTAESVALDVDGVVSSYFFLGDDNYGNPRYFRPVNSGNPLILRGPQSVPQIVRLPFDQGYLESALSVQWSTAEVNNNAVDRARYFAIRGQRASGTPTGPGHVATDPNGQVLELDDIEAKDYAVAVKASWLASTYGTVVEDEGRATLAIDRYEDPRLFGMPFQPLDGEWSALATTDGPGLEIAPLFTVGYGIGAALPTAMQCFYQLLLSTGAAPGWSGDETTDPTFTPGYNDPGSAEPWCGDVARADFGLGIPKRLVADPDDLAAEFDRVPGGRHGALSRIGLAYVGPQESQDVLESILRPRGLSWSLDGGQFGVVYLAPFGPEDAAVTIRETDIAGEVNDPSTTIPTQELRAVGQLDKTILKYRWDPRQNETSLELTARARDREASARRGDLKVELSDHGLIPNEWQVPTVDSWAALFRELWELERAEFFARRHFLIERLPLNRIKGSELNVGTRVRLTNPWPVSPAGGYGVTDACGIVIGHEYRPDDCEYATDILVFAGQSQGARVWMPLGKIVSVSGSIITLQADCMDLGADVNDASRFGIPEWSSVSVNCLVRVVWYDRTQWGVGSARTVTGTSGTTVTLSSAPPAADVYRDRDMWLYVAEDSLQTSTWVEAYGSPLVLEDRDGGFKLEP